MTSNLILTTAQDIQNETWKTIIIDDKSYLIRVTRRCNLTRVLLTNLIEIWLESLTKQEIRDKCRRLNPVLTVDNDEYEPIVENILNNISTHAVAASTSQIQLRMNYEGGIFKFNLDLCKGTSEDLWEHVTKPLCISSMELLYRQHFLLDLIKKKDIEITEYKAQHAELLRKYIETKPFCEDQFEVRTLNVDSVDYMNAFQKILELYTRINVKEIVKGQKKSSSTSIEASIPLQTETILEQTINESNIVHTAEISKRMNTKAESSSEHVLSNAASVSISNEDKHKMKTKKRGISTKMAITPIAHKKNRKTLNDFIL